jgi:peroxiredoxin
MNGKLLSVRLAYVTVPVGTLFAAGGIWMMVVASHANPMASSPSADIEPIHPVTAEMSRETAAWKAKRAPDFNLTDGAGKPWSLTTLTQSKPLFLYFIIDGCPCSEGAEPHFQRLYERYKGEANFAGIIGSDKKAAAAWATKHHTPYPVLADPSLKTIHAFDAKHSVYNLLVDADGTINSFWPGYSQDMLKDINAHIADACHIPVQPFDTLDAPLKMTSGCFYPTKNQG